jgi:hypothetical protein
VGLRSRNLGLGLQHHHLCSFPDHYPELVTNLKCCGEVLARWCFFELWPVYGTKVVLKPISSETAFSQNLTKTLEIKLNLSYLHCPLPLSVFIEHSVVPLVPNLQNNQTYHLTYFEFMILY